MLDAAIQSFDFSANNLDLLAWLIDLLAKSFLLVVVIRYLEQNYSRGATSAHKHKLWLTAIVLLGLLPISSSLTGPLFKELLPDSNLSLFTILMPANYAITSETVSERQNSLLIMAMLGYLSVLLFHISKLAFSFIRVHRIKRSTDYLSEGDVVILLEKLCKKLGISQKVTIGRNAAVYSPMTFGIKNPSIVLPSDSMYWDISCLENVLIHELSHIRRYDWLAFILAYLIASFNWFNPFVWQSLRRLSLEAELSCDNAVLKCGKPRKEFAEQILSIARRRLDLDSSELLAQSIVGDSELTPRIENILYQVSYAHLRREPFVFMSLCIVPVAFILISAGNVFAIGDENDYPSESLRLIYSESPLYPDKAFEKSVQGYAQFSFTVDENGDIEPRSINLEGSEPRNIFDESSLQALDSFKFKPRKVRGKTIATPGVRYTFKYNLAI